MRSKTLESFLEYPGTEHFYDLLGGLADNFLTLGGHAGKFLTCTDCGETFSLKDRSWACDCCGKLYKIHFESTRKPGTPIKTKLKVEVHGVRKPRSEVPGSGIPHWYFENENWSVAEFMTQVLRLSPETFLVPWINHLGVRTELPAELETILCWPRFPFGKSTVQPDVAIGFRSDVVLFEFKCPAGGAVPPAAIIREIAFGWHTAQVLDRAWHLVIVPGPDAHAKTAPLEYVKQALGALDEAKDAGRVPADIAEAVRAIPVDEIARSVTVIGWESMLKRTCEIITEIVPDSWTRNQVLAKLSYFQSERARLGLLSPACDP